ncbi:MAG: hypothetical protein ACI8P2_001537 [Candidatus Latescibacterota bacterium]|jgi:hypothetical protein
MRISLMLIAPICALLFPVLTGADELSTAPIKWHDPDSRPIEEPAEIVENQVWDIADHTFFFQVGKVLDLGWSARRIGNLLNIAPPKQADNLNELGEVPNSSWYENRHFLYPLNIAELKRGAGEAVPNAGGPWEIVAGKFEGGTAGFTIKDANGQRFLLKFDSEGNNEMGSAAEVIATKALYAAGYNVPRNSVVYFDPKILKVGRKATVPTSDGGKRPMQEADMQGILDNIIPQPDGTLRCVASAFLSGKPVGIFDYHGLRKDDANDRVDHEHRRELRGLRVIGSWMNDADRRAANTLDMLVEGEAGQRYIKHYLIDMGSAFGSNNLMPHLPKYGNEYVWDPRTILRSIVSLGFYRKPWEEPLPITYPELGYFENETFAAGSWVPTYPNPAFERCTNRDGYWGAKIVMSFSDEDIVAMVSTGHYSNAQAGAELTRLLAERRDMIGQYWYARVNPLDHFAVHDGALAFADLAVVGGLQEAGSTRYRFQRLDAEGENVGAVRELTYVDLERLGVDWVQSASSASFKRVASVGGGPSASTRVYLPLPADLQSMAFHGYEIHTQRGAAKWSKAVRAYFYLWDDGRYQLVRVEREE